MKPSAIGHRPPASSHKLSPRAAFTLVELIVVMTMMAIVIGLVAPSFRGFMRGRGLDNEVQRFLSLTTYGSSRAVSEGVPDVLWINVKQGRYGLASSGGYTETATNPVTFSVFDGIKVKVSAPSGTLTRSNFWTPATTRGHFMPSIQFQPDGFISDSSPQSIVFSQGPGAEIWVGENPTHQRYEIQTGHPKTARF